MGYACDDINHESQANFMEWLKPHSLNFIRHGRQLEQARKKELKKVAEKTPLARKTLSRENISIR